MLHLIIFFCCFCYLDKFFFFNIYFEFDHLIQKFIETIKSIDISSYIFFSYE